MSSTKLGNNSRFIQSLDRVKEVAEGITRLFRLFSRASCSWSQRFFDHPIYVPCRRFQGVLREGP